MNTQNETAGPHTPGDLVKFLTHALTALPNTSRNSGSYESITKALTLAKSPLLAAAPDLLTTLKYIKQVTNQHDDWWIGEFSNELDTAIAKAEGRA